MPCHHWYFIIITVFIFAMVGPASGTPTSTSRYFINVLLRSLKSKGCMSTHLISSRELSLFSSTCIVSTIQITSFQAIGNTYFCRRLAVAMALHPLLGRGSWISRKFHAFSRRGPEALSQRPDAPGDGPGRLRGWSPGSGRFEGGWPCGAWRSR